MVLSILLITFTVLVTFLGWSPPNLEVISLKKIYFKFVIGEKDLPWSCCCISLYVLVHSFMLVFPFPMFIEIKIFMNEQIMISTFHFISSFRWWLFCVALDKIRNHKKLKALTIDLIYSYSYNLEDVYQQRIWIYTYILRWQLGKCYVKARIYALMSSVIDQIPNTFTLLPLESIWQKCNEQVHTQQCWYQEPRC